MAKTYYTKELGKAIAKAAQRVNTGRYHVISGDAQTWTVVSEGHTRPMKTFPTQGAAIKYAKQTASKLTGEVFIHGKTGQIRDTISYAV